MMTREKVEIFNRLDGEEHELRADLARIDGFLSREPDNRDTARAVDKGMILVKFAGTACRLPTGLLEAHLRKRKAEIAERLAAIAREKEAL